MAQEDKPGSNTPNQRIVFQDIEDELKESYLTYAMSVIVSRALPDARDGLKPSQRRILVSMNDLNLTHKAKHRKCAKIVGECMGNYHPHGDSAIYSTLVRMAQDFNTRYLLVDGQGNFGSIDGDPPAAMRYTEARMAEATSDLLLDLDMDTVDTTRNFDDQRDEPTVLPSRFPNLICNGSTGIAVGMATNIPPHNVREVCDALKALIEDPEITVDGLMRYVKGPDFPTGARICGRRGIVQAYKTGKGIVTVRSKYHIEETKRRTSIIFTEIPYQESKVTIIDGISNAVKNGKIPGISDVRDESDKMIRLVVELKMDADEKVVINQLFKFTPLQTSFGINNIALVRGRPELLTLKEILNEYKKHRMEVLRRRTRFQLRKAQERAHIVEGLLKALDHIDRIIELIRGSATVEQARTRLMSEFSFSEIQAQEILNMRLQRLTGLERQKLEDELKDLRAKIDEYKAILAEERLVLNLILKDLDEIRERYGDDRKTEIIDEIRDVADEDLVMEEKVVVTVSRESYIKRTALGTYKTQHRGGFGITGSTAKEGDFIKDLFVASTHDYILFFTSRGRVYWLRVFDVPDMQRTAKGRAIQNLLALLPGETVTQQLCVDRFDEERSILLATRGGRIMQTPLTAFSRPMKRGINAIELRGGDSLIGAAVCRREDHVILGTKHGRAIRFPQSEIRTTARGAVGVIGIRLRGGDEVVDMVVADPKIEDLTLLTACEKGHGKRTLLSQYRIQARHGLGTRNIRTTEKNGYVVALKAVTGEDDLVLMTQNGSIIRIRASSLRAMGRVTQGVKLIKLREGDKLIGIERTPREEEEPEGGADEEGYATPELVDDEEAGIEPDTEEPENGEGSDEAEAEAEAQAKAEAQAEARADTEAEEGSEIEDDGEVEGDNEAGNKPPAGGEERSVDEGVEPDDTGSEAEGEPEDEQDTQ